MIQSCDCRLPAMIEPLHSPQQHKSMSITSPEHIRHFPFLLVISMAHRHIPIPHQAHSGASAHKQQSQGMKWFHCLSSNTYQHIESYASCDTEYKQFSSSPSPCAHTCIISVSPLITAGLAITVSQQLWKWIETSTWAAWPWTARVCVWAYMHACQSI